MVPIWVVGMTCEVFLTYNTYKMILTRETILPCMMLLNFRSRQFLSCEVFLTYKMFLIASWTMSHCRMLFDGFCLFNVSLLDDVSLLDIVR